MSQNFQTSYQPLDGGGGVVNVSLGEENETPDEQDDLSPQNHSGMLFHVEPKSNKSRWNHMEDLDTFFIRVYHYHQKNGFVCMLLQHLFELLQFIFVIFFTSFLFTCIDYDIVFRNKLPSDQVNITGTHKITITDAILTHDECAANFTWKLNFFIVMATFVWILKIVYFGLIIFQYWEIKQFFNRALSIQDGDLSNITWEEVEQRVMEVQVEQRMCIHKEVLTELDIYHRILRFDNYFIAMVNKEVIPLKFDIPFIGEVIFLTKGLRYNVDALLFWHPLWGPLSPFKNSWHLSDEYKRTEKRQELADELNKKILYLGIANLVLFPFVFFIQILFSFFSNAELIKREPGSLGSRRWSHYADIYLRHFNELDHELKARLNRGYRASTQYMNIFSSPILAVISRHVAFIGGSVLAVLAALTVYDEDVIQVEHVLTIMTILGAILAGCRVFIPEDNLVFCPEVLMRRILGEVHYLPDNWRDKAHTSRVRQEFSQLFQYRVVHIIEELVSPIITPIILIFSLRFKSQEIIDFYRNFTVEVVGVGDVCSFAQMDIRRHGSPTWQPDNLSVIDEPQMPNKPAQATDGGKTELSLLHFTMTNPKWQPPQESSAFIAALKTQAQKDMNALPTLQEENALYSSLNSLSCGGGLPLGVTSMMPPSWMASQGLQRSQLVNRGLRGGMNRLEGSRHGGSGGILTSINQRLDLSSVNIGSSSVTSGPALDPVMAPSTMGPSSYMVGGGLGPSSFLSPGGHALPQDLTAVDMSLSTLYLHEIHQRRRSRAAYTDTPRIFVPPTTQYHGSASPYNLHPSDSPLEPSVSFQQKQEKTPLLGDP